MKGAPTVAPVTQTEALPGAAVGVNQVRARVQLSNIKKAVETDPTVREERVASLRAAIQSGEYKVSDEKLAEKIIEHLLG